MRNINFCKTIFYYLLLIVVLGACKKEEKEVPLATFTTPHYDVGYLTVKIVGQPSVVTAIEYTNITRGVTSNINYDGFYYDQPSNTSVLSIALANGNVNDQVQCCVYLNGSTSIGIMFVNSQPTTLGFTSSPYFCENGTY
jgi:hypothetical protein